MMNQREPTLDELLSEPIIQQVMRSDGVAADDVRYLMQAAGSRPVPGMDGAASAFRVVTRHPQLQTFGCA